LIEPVGGGHRIRVMVAIKYKNPQRSGEACLVLLPECEKSRAEETREQLVRRGFVVVNDETEAPFRMLALPA
jgi:hypothetical protein